MKTLKLLLLNLLFTLSVKGQNFFKGNVYFLSSGYKPAVGVHVRDKEKITNGDYSKDAGEFTLEFSSTEVDKSITLLLGEENKKFTNAIGKELEWVNEREFTHLRTGRNANEKLLIVIVCLKGARDLEAQRYYKIIRTSSDLELAKKKKELKELSDLRQKDSAEIIELKAQINKMEKQIDSLDLMREAYNIASINKDEAEPNVLRFLQQLDLGKSIQEARKQLRRAQEVEVFLKEEEQRNENHIKELETRASASKALFDYWDVIECHETILSHYKRVEKDPLFIAEKLDDVGNAYGALGKYTEALEYFKNALKIREERFAQGHISIAVSYEFIAIAYSNLGLYEEGLKYITNALNIHKKNLTPEDRTAVYYQTMGIIYQHLGKYEEGLEFLNKALSIQQQIYAADHPKLADLYAALGQIYKFLGQEVESLKYFHKALNITEKTNVSDNVEMAQIYSSIGTIYGFLKQYSEGMHYFKKALKIYEEIYPPDHPDTGVAYGLIGSMNLHLEKYSEGLVYLKKGIMILEEQPIPNTDIIARLYSDLGAAYFSLEEYADGLIYIQKALKILEQILDSDHHLIKSLHEALVGGYLKLGKFEEVIEYYLTTLGTKPDDYPAIIQAYTEMGDNFNYLGIHNGALVSFQKALELQEKVLTHNHPDIVASYINIGSIYADLDSNLVAIEYLQKGLKLGEQTFTHDNYFPIIESYFEITATYIELRKYKEAIKCLQKALSIREQVFEKEMLRDVSVQYNSLSSFYFVENRLSETLNFLQKSRKIMEQIREASHPDIALLYDNIGYVYFNSKKYQEAIEYYEKSNNTQKNYENCNLIGLSNYYLKNYKEAINFYDKAALLSKEEFKNGSYYNNIGMAYAKNTQLEEAKTAFEKYEKLFPEEGRTYRNWAMYHTLKGEKEEALQNLQKAIELGYNDIEFIGNDDSLDSIRNEERFKEIVSKLTKE